MHLPPIGLHGPTHFVPKATETGPLPRGSLFSSTQMRFCQRHLRHSNLRRRPSSRSASNLQFGMPCWKKRRPSQQRMTRPLNPGAGSVQRPGPLMILATRLFSLNWMHRPEPCRTLDSQAGPFAAQVLTARPCCPELVLETPFFRAILSRRAPIAIASPTASAASAMTNMAITLQLVRGQAC